MKNFQKFILPVIILVIAGIAVTVAYNTGKNQKDEKLSELTEEVERLRAGEQEAAVVKRVSQQMEDIAYQQKAISDEQRDRAEEQSILATQNAERAEKESRAAHEAEQKANVAAEEAKKERANAEEQQKIAEEQRDEATHAKNVADTLNIRTQARTLGVTSQVRRESNDTEVADLLAYTSWYFLKNYRGNQYFADTFKALMQAVGDPKRYRMRQNSAVNAISQVPGKERQCVIASNYGEVELLTANGSGRNSGGITSYTLLNNKIYDFRDVLATPQCVYALAQKSTLCVLGYQGGLSTVLLPEENYMKIIGVGNKLLLAGHQSLCWYESGMVSAPIRLPKELSTLVKRGNSICLFYADGGYAEMNLAGHVETKKPLMKGVVTAAHYDEAFECLLLGMKDGTVYPVNKYNRVVETLAAHRSKCASIAMQGATVVTGGYDKMVYVWHMDNLFFESGMNFREEMKARTVSAAQQHNKKEIPTEWLVPVDLNNNGWTLSVCGDYDKKSVWVGTSNGNVIFQNVSADDMAQQLHKRIKRNLTQDEWTRYVGFSIPYMKFK